MINKNPSGNGISTNSWGGSRSHPVLASQAELHPNRLGDPVARQTPEPASPPEQSGWDWQMVVLWIFVAASFAALVFAGYTIWAKCSGVSP